METLFQDIRYGLRILRKSPLFTVVALISLAIGIGVNTSIFSLVHTILIKPLPVLAPEELVAIYASDSKNNTPYLPTAYANYIDLKQDDETFTDIAATSFMRVSFEDKVETEMINGVVVTGNYFDVLGIKPSLGRFFLPEESSTLGTHPVVVLGHGFWKKKFNSSQEIIGQQIILNRVTFTVIGVAPEGFRGTAVLATTDCWLPVMMHEQLTHGTSSNWFTERRELLFFLVGRLKPKITLQQAEVSLKTIAKRLETEYPKTNEFRSVTLLPLSQATIAPNWRGNIILASWLLMGAVGTILLIACANVANLLLARAGTRKTEIAVRLCLGASRGRLLQQLIIESLILSILGGALGLLLAIWSKDLLWSMRPIGVTYLDLSLNKPVLLFTLFISIFTGLLFGLIPAIQMSKPDLMKDLKTRIGLNYSGRGIFNFRNLLVIGQIALSVTALIIAGLFLRSFSNAQQINLGIDTEKLLSVSFDLDNQGYSKERGLATIQQLTEEAKTLPGVESVVFAANRPFFQPNVFNTRNVSALSEEINDKNQKVFVMSDRVDLDYFTTMGITLVKGRVFNKNDIETSQHVVIVNETMAKQFWPNLDPIGRKISVYGEKSLKEVVGVVKDSGYYIAVGTQAAPSMFFPIRQIYDGDVTLYVRTKENPKAAMGNVKILIRKIDPKMPLESFHTISSRVEQNLWAPRTTAALLSTFGIVALLLAMVGLYGVIAYWVNQRTHEIGVRMALGAKHKDLLIMILKQASTLIFVGLAVGILVSLILAKIFSSLLYDVKPFDVVTFIVAPIVLLIVALLASYLPARQVTKVDPITALRCE
jgi:putative ABC transport system permease protein